ncbi:unnamed protein product, partial [Meganyctiphanes norvegica]
SDYHHNKYEASPIRRLKTFSVNDKSRNAWDDNSIPYKIRNELSNSVKDKFEPQRIVGNRDLSSSSRISQSSFQTLNASDKNSMPSSRTRLYNSSFNDKFGGSLSNLHENPRHQTTSSRFMKEIKRRRVSSLSDLSQKENSSPYKPSLNPENRYGSPKFSLYKDVPEKRYGSYNFSEVAHTRIGNGICNPLGDLDGSGDSTESLLEEADKIMHYSLRS